MSFLPRLSGARFFFFPYPFYSSNSLESGFWVLGIADGPLPGSLHHHNSEFSCCFLATPPHSYVDSSLF
jgi:hypothetical protein